MREAVAAMTIDELYQRIDTKLVSMDTKLDNLAVKVERHDVSITANGHEMRDVKARVEKTEDKVSKLGNLVWWLLGGGTAAGASLVKLFS